MKSGEAGGGWSRLEGVEGTLRAEAPLSFKSVAGDAQGALSLSAMALGVVISTQSITTRDGRAPGVDGGTRGLVGARLSSSGSTSRDESFFLETGVASGTGCCCLLRVARLGEALSTEALRLGGILDASGAQYPRTLLPTTIIMGFTGYVRETISPPQLTFVQIGEMDKPTDVGVGAHRREHYTKSSCS